MFQYSRPKRALEQFYLGSSEQRVRILLVYNYYDATHLLFKMFSIDSRHKIHKILKKAYVYIAMNYLDCSG